LKILHKKNTRLLLLVALLLLLIAVFYFQRSHTFGTPTEETNASPIDVPIGQPFKIYPGTVDIERDLEAVSPSGKGPTALDGMNREQLTEFRLKKIDKYRQLGFFPSGYHPFSPPHNRIFGPITSGAPWLYSVPYYVANPYLLIILVAANHVTPIDMYVPEVNIRYQNGTMTETILGASARRWFEYVFASDYPGTIRLVMVNAWDAGFRYIHLDPSLSRNIGPGSGTSHVSRTWHEQPCIFHVGKYKKNNLSPEDRRAWIDLLERDKPTRLHVKLWRSKPVSVGNRADLIYIFNIDPR
jgi:hypothetical protein